MRNMSGADRHRIPRDFVGLWNQTPLGHTFTPHRAVFGQPFLAPGLLLMPSRALVVPRITSQRIRSLTTAVV